MITINMYDYHDIKVLALILIAPHDFFSVRAGRLIITSLAEMRH